MNKASMGHGVVIFVLAALSLGTGMLLASCSRETTPDTTTTTTTTVTTVPTTTTMASQRGASSGGTRRQSSRPTTTTRRATTTTDVPIDEPDPYTEPDHCRSQGGHWMDDTCFFGE